MIKTKRANALPPPPKEVLLTTLGWSDLQVEWLAGDGSDRCYYRLVTDKGARTYVLMQLSGNDADALREGGYDWLNIAQVLKTAEIPIPQPFKSLPEYAALIIEDYGDTMLESVVSDLYATGGLPAIQAIYQECFELIERMLTIKPHPSNLWCQRSFDENKFGWELRFFYKEFIEGALKTKFDEETYHHFLKEVNKLSQFLAAYSHFFVHRDFHSRNIMSFNNKLALIDFQDARLGNQYYDLVSLVFDNYVPLTAKDRKELCYAGLALCDANGIGSGFSRELKDKLLRATILQRQLKAIGTYGYLTISKKRGNYLRYTAAAIDSIKDFGLYDQDWSFISGELIDRIQVQTNAANFSA